MNRKILIFARYYIPSVKGGGPINSIKNLISNLSTTIDFYVVTSDRDIGDLSKFENVQTNSWTEVGKAKVMYVESTSLNSNKIIEILRELEPDKIYCNSFFDYNFSILPNIVAKKLKISKRILIAPRGEFSPGALSLKKRKKISFLSLAKTLKLYSKASWHATSPDEKEHIISTLSISKDKIKVAANLSDIEYKNIPFKPKEKGSRTKFVFLSRIHPKKNLLSALQYFKYTNKEIDFTIIGPIEDEEYWEKCKAVIDELNQNVKVNYIGTLTNEKVVEELQKHHFFLFPTLGENFGHVIIEALVASCPLIISDTTPWRSLDTKKIGWDISLKKPEKFIEIINQCCKMSENDYLFLSSEAHKFALSYLFNEEIIQHSCNLFN